jgi:hypothetical protein
MPSKKNNYYQHSEIILNKMIKISGLSQTQFAERDLGIKGANISEARRTGKIPDGWFEIFQKKYGVTKEELCASPDIKSPIHEGQQTANEALIQPQEPKDVFDQVMDNFFEMVKNWQIEENDRTFETAIEFTQEFSVRFPEMRDWLKKRGRGGDKGRLQEPVRKIV